MSHPDSEKRSSNYEHQDVHISALTAFMVSLLAFMAGAVIISIGLHKGYRYIERSRKVDVSPLADYRRVPPEPRLQVDPTADMVKYAEQEETVLQTYAWIDADRRVVRLPIDRAKKLILERGL